MNFISPNKTTTIEIQNFTWTKMTFSMLSHTIQLSSIIRDTKNIQCVCIYVCESA